MDLMWNLKNAQILCTLNVPHWTDSIYKRRIARKIINVHNWIEPLDVRMANVGTSQMSTVVLGKPRTPN